MSTQPEFPLALGQPAALPGDAPALRLVPDEPLDFDDAVTRVRPRLHRYALRRLGDTHEAEELVQEALLRAYSHRDQLLTEDDLSAWTTVVTGRLVIDRLRVRGRSTSFADVPENGRLGRDTADVVVARDEARTALDALDAMPTRQAALLWAREVEGHTYEELCQRFGMTEPAVRSVLTRARKALRKEYAHRGGTLPVGGLAVLAPWIAGLTWVGKLRHAATRVTGPAVLATIGITALGGLVLNPFGAPNSPHVDSFAPVHAIVASGQISDHGSLGGLDGHARSRHTTGTVTQSPPRSSPHGALQLAEKTACQQKAADAHDPVFDDLPGGTPLGAGYGGSHCRTRTNAVIQVPLPTPVGGYRYLGTSTDLVHCSQIAPVTATKLVTCTERPQP